MEALFHLIFELFKIVVLASVYSFIIFYFLHTLGRYFPGSWFYSVSQKKLRLWFLSCLVISIILFAFMFSYWGNHGLGDSARIPLGNGKAVEQINGAMTYITPTGYESETLTIDEFAVTKKYLFAKVTDAKTVPTVKEIAVWNLKTNGVEFLEHYSDIEIYKTKNKITEQLIFQSFGNHYASYWGGWRFWLLP
jgi:hypothetical protein